VFQFFDDNDSAYEAHVQAAMDEGLDPHSGEAFESLYGDGYWDFDPDDESAVIRADFADSDIPF